MVRLRLADRAAFLMFFLAAFFCFVVAIRPLGSGLFLNVKGPLLS
jgi:hypothetical protein